MKPGPEKASNLPEATQHTDGSPDKHRDFPALLSVLAPGGPPLLEGTTGQEGCRSGYSFIQAGHKRFLASPRKQGLVEQKIQINPS